MFTSFRGRNSHKSGPPPLPVSVYNKRSNQIMYEVLAVFLIFHNDIKTMYFCPTQTVRLFRSVEVGVKLICDGVCMYLFSLGLPFAITHQRASLVDLQTDEKLSYQSGPKNRVFNRHLFRHCLQGTKVKLLPPRHQLVLLYPLQTKV